jgi:predicted RNA-binding Zn-ribbon protein involved in translation (DUF1610 family)
MGYGGLAMAETSAEIRCPLCGYRFSEDKLECHTACPLSESCQMACCPKCGYQIVRDTKTVKWMKKLLGRSQ